MSRVAWSMSIEDEGIRRPRGSGSMDMEVRKASISEARVEGTNSGNRDVIRIYRWA